MPDTVVAAAGAVPSGLPDYPIPRSGSCPFGPSPALRALREEGPVTKVRLWDGSTPWLVTSYADQRAPLGDPRLSADSTHIIATDASYRMPS